MNKMGVGQITMSGREHIVAVGPVETGLVVEGPNDLVRLVSLPDGGAICAEQIPPWQDAGEGHQIFCHIPLETLRQLDPVVEAMFSAKRSSVVSSRTEGNAVNSSGFWIISAVISTRIEDVIEIASRKSSNIAGSGTSMIARMPSTPAASAISPRITNPRNIANEKAVPCGCAASVICAYAACPVGGGGGGARGPRPDGHSR